MYTPSRWQLALWHEFSINPTKIRAKDILRIYVVSSSLRIFMWKQIRCRSWQVERKLTCEWGAWCLWRKTVRVPRNAIFWKWKKLHIQLHTIPVFGCMTRDFLNFYATTVWSQAFKYHFENAWKLEGNLRTQKQNATTSRNTIKHLVLELEFRFYGRIEM